MREETYDTLMTFLDEDGQSALKDSYELDGDVYQLKSSVKGEKREALAASLLDGEMVVTALQQMESAQSTDSSDETAQDATESASAQSEAAENATESASARSEAAENATESVSARSEAAENATESASARSEAAENATESASVQSTEIGRASCRERV